MGWGETRRKSDEMFHAIYANAVQRACAHAQLNNVCHAAMLILVAAALRMGPRVFRRFQQTITKDRITHPG